ncbi:MAG: NYN domain-containing protein [Planctomycetaceae bacterium]
MSPFLIIDGYNLLHAAGLARRRYGPGDLERLRNRLLNWLAARLDEQERQRATIVFDAGDEPTEGTRETRLHEMTVLFATTETEADELIEALIAGHSAPKQIRVVSGDRRLQRAATRRRGTFVTSDDFHDELDRREPIHPTADRAEPAHEPPSPKYTGHLSAEETREWLRVFGEVPGAKGPDDETGLG